MPVNPCYTQKDLDRFSIVIPDELNAIVSVLREITISEEMRTAQTFIILWCADSIEHVSKTIAKHIRKEPRSNKAA